MTLRPRLWRACARAEQCLPPAALSIGNFDGVHSGHQQLLASLKQLAHAHSLPSRVITFDPLPQEYFAAKDAPARLSNLDDRLHALHAAGIDEVVLLRFDAQLAALEARTFAESLLCERLGARALLIGDDFRFGRKRAGDAQLLRDLCQERGMAFAQAPTYAKDNLRISSTAVRQALAAADFSLAAQLLGRAYEIRARIGVGDQLGRQLGCPTANFLHRLPKLPLRGVFVAEVFHDGHWHPAVSNFGYRPSVAGQQARIEAHLLHWQGDLYAKRLILRPLKKLRDEKRFANLAQLTAAINADMQAASDYFHNHQHNRL